MFIHMKRTTLVINEQYFIELKRLAAAQGRTLSDLVNEFLKAGLLRQQQRKKIKKPFRLPSFSMGRPALNIADRDRLEEAMR